MLPKVMSFRRLFTQIYYSKSRGFALFIILLIAAFLIIPRFLDEKGSSKTVKDVDSKQKLLEQKEEKDILKLPETSLKINKEQFILNGKPFTILGGSVHYFRVVPQYWEDRLMKLKAMGLNTVTTSIPWSIHEEFKDFIKFNLPNYDIVSFIEIAQKLGLYVILRPGPYIDAQMDFGGLPSWLLRDNNVKLRSSDPLFIGRVEKYFKQLLDVLTPLQYSNGGPIIAWQIENKHSSIYDKSYMRKLQRIMIENGVKELMFTTETWNGLLQNNVNLPGVLKGISMEYLVSEKQFLADLKSKQPGKPLFVTEFWSGANDRWGGLHQTENVENASKILARILAMGVSVNFYLFHGGTNFGFINGADCGEKFQYMPMVTSFDCDALLNEAGDVTHKYKELRKVLKAHTPEHSFPKTLPEIPPDITRKVYDSVKMGHHIPLNKMYKRVDQRIEIKEIVPMEQLYINNNGGQSYGFIVYRTKIPVGAKTLFIEKYRDWAQVMVGSELIATLNTMSQMEMVIDSMMNVKIDLKHKSAGEDGYVFLDIIVENLGRGAECRSHNKGLIGDVFIDGESPKKWTVFPLSFHKQFVTGFFHETQWDSISNEKHESVIPGFFKGTLVMTSKPRDTFLDMSDWGKGVVFLNDRVVGRYWSIGPQQTLYVPSVWFQPGENTIVILEFEKQSEDGFLKFSKDSILDKLNKV